MQSLAELVLSLWQVLTGWCPKVMSKRDRESCAKLCEHAETLKKNVEELAKDYPSFPKEKIHESMGLLN